jgi:hypothetical protein
MGRITSRHDIGSASNLAKAPEHGACARSVGKRFGHLPFEIRCRAQFLPVHVRFPRGQRGACRRIANKPRSIRTRRMGPGANPRGKLSRYLRNAGLQACYISFLSWCMQNGVIQSDIYGMSKKAVPCAQVPCRVRTDLRKAVALTRRQGTIWCPR